MTEPMTAGQPPGHRVGGGRLAALASAAARAPLTGRARREFLFCLIEVPLGLCVLAAPFTLAALAGLATLVQGGAGGTATTGRPGHLVGVFTPLGGLLVGALLLLILTPRAARWLGAVHRHLAARLLGERVARPAPVRPSGDLRGWLAAWLRDGPGWRAAAYSLVKLPVTVCESYAVFLLAAGLVDMTYPFWWRSFRNHAPNVVLQPVPVVTPFGSFRIATFPGTFAALAAGAAMVLAAPWVARAATSADRWLIRGLLGPGRLAQRVRELEQTRALAVDNSTALLRQVERNLHDGAQARLATLAMNLGMAKEKLGDDGRPTDIAAARELVDAAHRGAKDALVELRDLARGIHPPVLDTGLADALATLAAGSPAHVELTTAITERPTPAIETIAYFCAAELLANAVKHSAANKINIDLADHGALLALRVADDGRGGADPAHGSGLSGLAQRVSTVDGRMSVASPPGGPTEITVTLPLRA